MRRSIAFLLITGTGVLTSCAQGPSSPIQPGAQPGTLATVVDVPISVDVTDGLTGTWNWAGQSVTIPTGSNVGNVRFAWYHYNPRGETTAFGRIYVLDREFLGVPGDLSPSMPGFLARSEPEPVSTTGGSGTQGTEYTLPDSLVLNGGARYWFYSDKQGAFATSFDKDLYAGGNFYVTGYFANPFRVGQASGRMVNGVFVPATPGVTTDANFRLRGVAR
jgi:hypothetical protein